MQSLFAMYGKIQFQWLSFRIQCINKYMQNGFAANVKATSSLALKGGLKKVEQECRSNGSGLTTANLLLKKSGKCVHASFWNFLSLNYLGA